MAARDHGRRRIALWGGLVTVLIAGAALAPVLAPYPPNEIRLRDTLLPPTGHHWLGTDNQGRDLFSRVLYGARLSLVIAGLAVGSAATVGTALGLLAGYSKRWDSLVMRPLDILMAFPGIVIALTMIAIIGGPGVSTLVIAIGVYQVPQFARIVRSAVLVVRHRAFLEAGIALGLGHARLIGRHVLPNVLNPLIVNVSLFVPDAMMTAASLSFLGLGVAPPTAEWGSMLQNSLQWFALAPHVMIVPGLALTAAVMSFNLLGDGLRDVLDPQAGPA
jgi:peptide/nickel transport system permease protein